MVRFPTKITEKGHAEEGWKVDNLETLMSRERE